jgi:hypothetical protein
MVGWALGACLLVLAVLLAAGERTALAQDPGTNDACIINPAACTPTPTPTPSATATATPTGTPFSNSGPTGTPTPTPAATPVPSATPPKLRPFPVVRTAGSFTRTSTTFTRVTVRGPKGSKLAVSCTKRRCRLSRTLGSSHTLRLRSLQRTYKAGTVLVFRITAANKIGKYVAIRTRRGKPPIRRDGCLRPGSPTPTPCGAS